MLSKDTSQQVKAEGIFQNLNLPFLNKTEDTAAASTKKYGPYKVKRVVDGDTLLIDYKGTDTRLRLIGVDTPESVHSDSSRNTVYGKRASDYTKKKLTGKKVYLEFDTEDTDRYGRLLAYVYTKKGKRYAMYNKTLVKQGLARAACYEPNHRYKSEFEKLQKQARKAKRGFWKAGLEKAFPGVYE